MSSSAIDPASAHRFFSVHCFNRAWGFIERNDRSDDDNVEMVLCALASLWHWRQRDDCGSKQLSIGCWQVSRVYALACQAENARHYAEWCLKHSAGLPAFYRGYAHEALARSAELRGSAGAAEKEAHLQAAKALMEQIDDSGDRAALDADLQTLKRTGER